MIDDRAEATARALREAGVDSVFGVTGSGFSLSLISAFERLGGTYYAASHEGAAAVMAGAGGRVSTGIAAAVTIKGPGFANLLPGQLSNLYEGWPVISVSEAFAEERSGRAHKLLDQRRAAATFVKASGALGDPGSVIAQLAGLARAESPGPVHVDVPSRDEPRFDRFIEPRRAAANPAAIDRVAGARRPVVIAGSWAVRQGWGARLASLKVPVFTTVSAKGLLDETLPHAAGVYTGDGLERSVEKRILPDADAVIGLGLRSAEVLTPRPFGVPAVILDALAGAADGFDAALGSVDDAEAVWAALAARQWGESEVAAAKQSLDAHLFRAPWVPAGALATLQRHAGGCRLFVDTGLFCTAAEHVWTARHPHDVLLSANGRFMGTGLPMAIGGGVADRRRAGICVVGDGGLPPVFGEIRLALQKRLPLLIVFMTDGGYGSVAGPAGFHARSARATSMGTPSWWRVADAAGVPGCRVADADAFERAVAGWDGQTLLFVEAAFDPAAYARATEGVR